MLRRQHPRRRARRAGQPFAAEVLAEPTMGEELGSGCDGLDEARRVAQPEGEGDDEDREAGPERESFHLSVAPFGTEGSSHPQQRGFYRLRATSGMGDF